MKPPDQPPSFSRANFDTAPFLVLWEMTRACALACQHCRAKAIKQRNPNELSTEEAFKVLDDLSGFGQPLIVLTGGDPIQRPDVFAIIERARQMGFTVAMTPSATPSVTRETVRRLKDCGLARLAISLDGPDPQTHDSFRRVPGSFNWSLDILSWAREVDLPIQINTTVCRHNFDRFDEMARLAGELTAVLWSVFFLVPTGRARLDMQISAEEAEEVMLKMSALATSAPFDIKSTAGPHFRRLLIQKFAREEAGHEEAVDGACAGNNIARLKPALRLGALRSYQSVNDGKGLVFISDTGDILPSGFLPIVAGNVRNDSVVSVYREHPLFTSLRNPSMLKGKCGACRYKAVCGGSRARAYGETGDYLAQDSLCNYYDRAG